MSEQSSEPAAPDELREIAAAAEKRAGEAEKRAGEEASRRCRGRAVLDNAWAGGHGGAGWEAIEIGF